MLSIETIAKVVINAVRAAGSPAAFDTGLIMTPVNTDVYAESKRLMSFTSSNEAVTGLIAAGFTTADQVYKAAVKYFAVNPSPGRLLVSCYPKTEDPATALGTVLNKTCAFYGVMAAGVTDDDALKGLEEAIRTNEHPMMLFVPIPNPVSYATADDGLLKYFYDLVSKRVVCLYASQPSDAAALMGAAMGLELSHPTSSFSMCYQTINGIAPQNLSAVDVAAIEGLNGNVYITRGYTHRLLEKGTTSSGMRYDEVLYLDLIADALQTEAVALIAENDVRLPQTDDTTAQFVNRFSAILQRFKDRGVLAKGVWRGGNIGPIANGDIVESGYVMWADSYDVQSDADRAAHKAMPINVALTMAGSVESIVIAVNVVL